MVSSNNQKELHNKITNSQLIKEILKPTSKFDIT